MQQNFSVKLHAHILLYFRIKKLIKRYSHCTQNIWFRQTIQIEMSSLIKFHARMLSKYFHILYFRYLHKVINETIRCAVIIPWTARYQDNDSELGGYKIPAKVRYNVYKKYHNNGIFSLHFHLQMPCIIVCHWRHNKWYYKSNMFIVFLYQWTFFFYLPQIKSLWLK